MKRLAILTGILALAAPVALAQTSTWVSDPNHSEVDFSIIHLSVSKIHGRFGNVNATIVYNEGDVTKSTVTATIGVDTVDTGVDQRNTHLKSPDFFDIATMPTATFTSTSVAKNGNHLTVTGDLTLHGVTKPVTFLLSGGKTAEFPKGVHRTGFSAEVAVKRSDFGVTKFAGAVGDNVYIEVSFEGTKK